MKNTPFNIVNASAGSGKTYRLVKEYILLLINTENNRTFSSIIAMTFTNKAAIEMKERIISSLDKISSPELCENKLNHLTKELAVELGIKTEEVINRCRKVLINILHQYEDFNVLTIDKFNLRLIRSFGKELELEHDFKVIMDKDEVLEKIVDEILGHLGIETQKDLNKLLLEYAKSNIDEGNSWNIRRSLIKFGEILTKEKNEQQVKMLLDMNFSLEQFKHLKSIQKEMDTTFMKKANDIIALFHSGEIDQNSLPGKSGTLKRLNLITKDKNFFSKDPHLYTNSIHKNLEHANFPLNLKNELLQLDNYWNENILMYIQLKLYLKNFFNMALLKHMALALKKIKKEEQMILINEFSSLISGLIHEENASYVYERLGTRFQHYLLDEFQDTSHKQWLNIVPLIHDSLGTGKKNLIVGDAKQSIYRFKNGLAEQFIELPRIYNPENDKDLNDISNFFENQGFLEELKFNYRSSSNIVNFNNSFFEELKKNMSEKTASYYNSIHQTPHSEINGTVTVLSKAFKTTNEQIVERIIEWVDECEKDGFKRSDICILGSKNKLCNSWAIQLTEKGYTVVSVDSLLIDSDRNVQLTINYLYWRLRHSENDKKKFIQLFLELKNQNYLKYNSYIKKTEKGRNYVDQEAFFNDFFGGKENFLFHYENIYDLIQRFYRLMEFNELENPYLHHLADICFDFELKKGPNLRLFLKEYERTKSKIAVQIPESEDAIKIMTIHKSKGLEFPVVILPDMNYNLTVKEKFLIKSDDFIIYKTPSSKDILPPLIENFEEESEQVRTDATNICYVAMTRPVERLYIQNYFDKTKFGRIFHEVLYFLEGIKEKDGELFFQNGNKKRNIEKSDEKKPISFFPKNTFDKLWFPDISLQDNDDLNHKEYLSNEMQFGIQFHLLASKITPTTPIKDLIDKHVQIGEVLQANAKELKVKLEELMNSKEYISLFENHVDILNEQTFIVNEDETIRPDKIILKKEATIIIDFKTGIPENKDVKQVKNYQAFLRKMNYPNVQCYLYYSSLGELRQVG